MSKLGPFEASKHLFIHVFGFEDRLFQAVLGLILGSVVISAIIAVGSGEPVWKAVLPGAMLIIGMIVGRLSVPPPDMNKTD